MHAFDYLVSVINDLNTPASVLANLAKNKLFWVRRNVGFHPNTPASSLDLLANDDSAVIREIVANHASTSSKTLDMLSRDKNNRVVNRVMLNKNTTKKTLLRLSKQGVCIDSVWPVLFGRANGSNPSSPSEYSDLDMQKLERAIAYLNGLN